MSNEAVADESVEMDKINAIDPDHNFHPGGIVENCEIGDLDSEEESEEELDKCGSLYSPDNSDLRNIILRYGGLLYTNYLKRLII